MNIRSFPDRGATPALRRLLLACGVGIAISPAAEAACSYALPLVCLSNEPIQSANIVKPNVMFVFDNSGSMAWDIMSVDSGLSENVNRGRACRKNFQYNSVYYNPNIDYTSAIPKNASGASMGSQPFNAAKSNPFTSASTVSLLGNFCAVAAQCSSGDANPDLRPQNGYYYKYTGPGSPGSNCDTNNAHYTKVVVGVNSCQVGGDVAQCPTGADERTNFANWYSYFRTRVLMMKSGMATAFSTIDDKIRVGFHTINNPSSGTSSGRSLNIDDFAATQKNNWYTALFSLAPSGGTPLREALSRVGNYYRGSGTMTGLSGDPVQYSCQKNFTILATDGYWNGSSTAVTITDTDMTIPAAMPIKAGNAVYNPADTGLVENATFPRPYYEGTTATSKTLADVAMYYWVNDQRTSGAVAANNVPTTTADPAYWQHMNTYTVGLGVNGQLSYPADLANLTNGSKNWPVPVADTVTAVDDLWHAAVNGRGSYYRATDPTSLSASLNSALKAVTDVLSYGVGPASSTNNFKLPDQSDFTTYESFYRIINWSGDVKKYNVDKITGAKTGAALWSASEELDKKVNPGQASTINPTAYTSRIIVTRKENGSPVEFDYQQLSSTQQAALCYKVSPGTGPCVSAPPTDRDSLVNYLRGDGAFEGDYGVSGKRFRNRQDKVQTQYFKRDLFGTIVNAKPAYVAAEPFGFQDSSDPGFSTFKKTAQTRARTLYVPANDGMIHAIDATSGDERWAYIPSLVIPTGTDENGRETGLRTLSYQDGGAPAYYHHFLIDATPAVGSVDFLRAGYQIQSTSPSGDWRTMLVGGLGKGGKGYYALDVTTPASSPTAAKAAVLWEFPNGTADASHQPVISGGLMGYSYGEPVIVKTYAHGWVVIVPSGYNNADGYGYLFVLNAKTGALLKSLKTPSQAPGLAHITGLVKANNRYVSQVYGGDLNGNVWRFDVSDPSPSNWTVSQIFSSSTATPITSPVDVAIDPNDGSRWVFIGTGKYLDVADRTTAIPTQYLVALKDGKALSPKTFSSPVALSALATVSNLLAGVSSAPLGWKYALPNPGERVVAMPWGDLRTVVFITLLPTTDPCSPGSVGYAYGLQYDTGMSRLIINGAQVPYYYSATGIAGAAFQSLASAGAGAGSGKARLRIYTNDGQTASVDLDTRKINSGTRHVGWRELLNEY